MTETKLTNVNIFIDTNILIYLYSTTELEKKKVVENLFLLPYQTIISTQVLNEFLNVMAKKNKYALESLLASMKELSHYSRVAIITEATIERALIISSNHKYSYFDSLIIASAIENNCTVLFSEDMQNNHVIEKLKIRNPFKLSK